LTEGVLLNYRLGEGFFIYEPFREQLLGSYIVLLLGTSIEEGSFKWP
jgi:hypothetical protein